MENKFKVGDFIYLVTLDYINKYKITEIITYNHIGKSVMIYDDNVWLQSTVKLDDLLSLKCDKCSNLHSITEEQHADVFLCDIDNDKIGASSWWCSDREIAAKRFLELNK